MVRPHWLYLVAREFRSVERAQGVTPHDHKRLLRAFEQRLPPPVSPLERAVLAALLTHAATDWSQAPFEIGLDEMALAASKAMTLIKQRYSECWSVPKLGREVGSHPSTLTRQFKEAIGCTVHKYLTHVRMEVAAELLANTDLKVEAVGWEVGYESKKTFHEQFKKYYCTTPARYRENPVASASRI